MTAKIRTAILLINTGSPDAPTAQAVRRYLSEFLSDKRVIELPQWQWWPILHGIILRVRPSKSARRYEAVWLPEGSPLIVHTQRTVQALAKVFCDEAIEICYAMRYGNPSVQSVIDKLCKAGVERLLVMPMFAQYATQTSAACIDAVAQSCCSLRNVPALRTIKSYHVHTAYINALKQRIERFWRENGTPMSVGGKLVMSFHGIPEKSSHLGDPYETQCHETAAQLASALGLNDNDWVVTFQSRFGRQEWLKPYTQPTVARLADEGVPRVDLVCPGFAADCLETIEEINEEVRSEYERRQPQGRFLYIDCLNDTPEAIIAYEEILRDALSGWVESSRSATLEN